MLSKALVALALAASAVKAQVTATGTMGTDNPPAATYPTTVNQTSVAKLLSVNSVDDFCIFAPPEPGASSTIGDTEAIEVAWCVQPRNNARVIPDGVLQAVHFYKTPLYVQVVGWGDFTKLNIPEGDEGGELDPHGATGLGNPVGGNVTSNITGEDVNYQEWMNYMSYTEFCIRVCIAENSTYSAANECQHTLDEMGCEWVMPADYTQSGFTSCEADSAYPPGWYPEADGTTSTFAQRYTGTYTDGSGALQTYTIGETITPQTPYSTPASSNCVTYATVSNGISSLAISAASSTASVSAATSAASSGASSASRSGSAAASQATSTRSSSASGSAATSASATGTSGAMRANSDSFGSLVVISITVLACLSAAGVLFL